MAHLHNLGQGARKGVGDATNLAKERSSNPVHATMYPDPSDMPSYPWLGTQELHSPSQFASTVARNSNNSPTQSDDEGSCPGLGAISPVRNEGDNPLLDPDFQDYEESIADDYMSDAGSDSAPTPRYLQDRNARPPRSRIGGTRRARGRGGRRPAVGRGAKGVKRGPRRALEPNIEFKALTSQATVAFISGDYDEAERIALKAIKRNPEMYAAHSLLSEIHMARGDRLKAMTALFNGAHTRPGHAQGWLRVARLVLDLNVEQDQQSTLRNAVYCLSRVINIEQDNVEARYQRASLNRELGFLGRAATEYEQILKYRPHDTEVLRHLAEISVDSDEVEGTIQLYDASIAYHQSKEDTKVASFSWSDVNVYIELYGYQEQYEFGILKLKSLSRWLLDRKDDHVWDTYTSDDREWDAEDEPRRNETPRFVPGAFPACSYGDGLPLELRVKLGVFRLRLGHWKEGLNHFRWLEPERHDFGAKLFDFPDLFRESADALRVAELHKEALMFYEPLQAVENYADLSCLIDMATCYRAAGCRSKAEDCYQSIVNRGGDGVEVRSELIAMRTEDGTSERSDDILKQLYLNANNRAKAAMDSDNVNALPDQSSFSCSSQVQRSRPIFKSSNRERGKRQQQRQREQERDSRIYGNFLRIEALTEQSRLGNEHARAEWTAVAKDLIQDFRSNGIFYPTDRYMRFFGYSSEARAQSAATKPGQSNTENPQTSDITDAIAGAPSSAMPNCSYNQNQIPTGKADIPDQYCGIAFKTWLDIFLEYAFYLAESGNLAFAYDIVAAARDANVFYHARESMLLIHICWFTCALLQNDDKTLCNVCRWFMKEYQFTTDSYRLFVALNRLADCENTWFNCGPSQKYILRQIKAADLSLVSNGHRNSLLQERAAYSRNGHGNAVLEANMDIALLMLYGQILYHGRSFAFALNYFFRAYALDPANPAINLSMALSYLHHAFKRQVDNRHHLILQGLAFLSAYRDLRLKSGNASERQEAEYNSALVYHSIGLTHLANRSYQQCLTLQKESRKDSDSPTVDTDEFSREAALGLRGLLAMSGDYHTAQQLTKEWLVIE